MSKPEKHYFFEGSDDFEEIVDKANVGDFIEEITSNQMDWKLHKVVKKAGKKTTEIVKTMEDVMKDMEGMEDMEGGRRGGPREERVDDIDDKSLQLINEIKAEPENKNDGINRLYLAQLAYIKRKPIQQLDGKERSLARQAYLSLLNKGETVNTISSIKLADEMRRISQPVQRGPQPIMNNPRILMRRNMRPIQLPALGNPGDEDQERRERVNMRGEEIEGMFANAIRGGKKSRKSMKKYMKKGKKSMKKSMKKGGMKKSMKKRGMKKSMKKGGMKKSKKSKRSYK